MKKLGKLLIIFVFCFILSGCEGINYAKEIMSADNNMLTLDSYKVKMTIDLGISVNDEKISSKIYIDDEYNAKNEVEHTNLKIVTNLLELKMEGYSSPLNEQSYQNYFRLDGTDNWFKSIDKISADDSVTDEQVDVIFNMIKDNITVDKVDSLYKDMTQYHVVIGKDAVSSFLNYILSLETNLNDSAYKFSSNGDMNIDIFVNKDNYISIMTIDMAPIIFVEGNENVKITRYYVKIETSNFNEYNDLQIPANIINKAILVDSDNNI